MTKKYLIISCIFFLNACSSQPNESDLNYCANIEPSLNSASNNFWSCINSNTDRLTDKTTPPNDIATAVIYACNQEVGEMSVLLVEKTNCSQSVKFGKSLAYIRENTPLNKSNATKIMSEKARPPIINRVLENRAK
ncbi:TPA: hypothetical protein ACNIBN_001936 [Klebsiella pneumoniae]|uniref:hypothetical protein n=1 Tax=Klebsiella pneumoniae TaxID=573 RepID=UPI001EF8A09F|nr:hypothetical protein [Klebsiella pneumoniae]ULI94040.1 hypothetical protein HUZ59_06670 [Klebsiella pneumoniae]HCC6224552.1 hypothetical protein [Klebsiella pneumoniae]